MHSIEPLDDEPEPLSALRSQLVRGLAGAVAALAVVPVITGVWLSLQTGLPVIAAFDVAAWVLLVALWRAPLSANVRAASLIALVLLVGHVLLVVIGPLGFGFLWLAAAPGLAGVFFDRRGLWATMILAGASLIPLWWWVGDQPEWSSQGQPLPVSWWVLAATTVACVSLFVGHPATVLVQRLERLVERQSRHKSELRALAARESELHARFEALFARSPLPLLLLGPGGAIRQRNEAARELYGDEEGSGAAAVADLLRDPAVREAVDTFTAASSGPSTPSRGGQVVLGGQAPVVVDVTVASLRLDDGPAALVATSDVTARVHAEGRVASALREKETLLREIHHRVKNNLQVVSSLLDLQGARVGAPEARAALDESARRIRAMALVHRQLYGGVDLGAIDLGAYASQLAQELRSAFDPGAELALAVSAVPVPLARAVPVGLVLNELMTNAFKHGRSGDGRLRVRVEVGVAQGEPVLRVADAGPGLAEPWESLRLRSLGGRIVESLAKQLDATLSVSSGAEGTTFELRCRPPAARTGAGADPRSAAQA